MVYPVSGPRRRARASLPARIAARPSAPLRLRIRLISCASPPRLSSSPDADQGRIEAIRQAIADGSYEIDAQRIADKLLKLEDQL